MGRRKWHTYSRDAVKAEDVQDEVQTCQVEALSGQDEAENGLEKAPGGLGEAQEAKMILTVGE